MHARTLASRSGGVMQYNINMEYPQIFFSKTTNELHIFTLIFTKFMDKMAYSWLTMLGTPQRVRWGMLPVTRFTGCTMDVGVDGMLTIRTEFDSSLYPRQPLTTSCSGLKLSLKLKEESAKIQILLIAFVMEWVTDNVNTLTRTIKANILISGTS